VDRLWRAAHGGRADAISYDTRGDDLAHRVCTVYVFIFAFGILYIYRLLRAGPVGSLVLPPVNAIPNRPMSVVDHSALSESRRFAAGE
jgi:hypothetical protein